MPRLPMLLLGALACKRRGADTASPHSAEDPPPEIEAVWWGDSPGAGLGAALVQREDGRVLASAPWGGPGQVRVLTEAGTRPWMAEGEPGGLGIALARGAEGVLVGAPLQSEGAGAVIGEGGALERGEPGELLGGVLYADDTHTLVGSREGVWVDGDFAALDGAPRALAWADSGWWAGLPAGDTALVGPEGPMARVTPGDEAGYALCAADLDGDGADDLAVGAPGAGRVVVLLGATGGWEEAVVLEGEGRFGHALACEAGALVVGAPLHGPTLRGAVWAIGPSLSLPDTPLREGEVDWEQLGGAVLLTPTQVWAGGWGGEDAAGIVRRLPR